MSNTTTRKLTILFVHIPDQDKACVKNCDLPLKEREHFEQPIWQTLNMFIGESLCLVVASICAFLADKYGRAKWADLILDDQEEDALAVVESDGLIVPEAIHGHGHGAPLKQKKKLQGAHVLLLWLPTLCDMTASTVRPSYANIASLCHSFSS